MEGQEEGEEEQEQEQEEEQEQEQEQEQQEQQEQQQAPPQDVSHISPPTPHVPSKNIDDYTNCTGAPKRDSKVHLLMEGALLPTGDITATSKTLDELVSSNKAVTATTY